MKDKITLLMEETGCEQGEAELALEICGFDVEKAVRVIPRLFHNIAVLKGKARVREEALHILFLAILNLKDRSLLRARAVASYNPAVLDIPIERNWFEFEKHLYACRLRPGSIQHLSQEAERLLAEFFASREAAAFHSEASLDPRGRGPQALAQLLSRRFHPHSVRLEMYKDVLDMAQFQEIPYGGGSPLKGWPRPRRRGASGTLVLRIALEGSYDGIPADGLMAGDLVYAQITDARDIARYLARLLGASSSEPANPGKIPAASILAPVEAVEKVAGKDVLVRVRLSLGVCGDVSVPKDIRLKAVRKTEASWWRKLFV